MRGITYFVLTLFILSACQQDVKKEVNPLNPEIMNFVRKYNDLLVKEDLLQEKRYAICVHVENRFDTIKIYVCPWTNYNWVKKLGEPTFEDSVGKRKVYLYFPQLEYLYPNRPKVKLDPSYFSKTDTLMGCMIPNLTFKRYGKDSIVSFTELQDSPIMAKLIPPPSPNVEFVPMKIKR